MRGQGQGAQDPGERLEEGFRRPHLRGSGPHPQGCGSIQPALKAFLLPQLPIFEASGLTVKAVEAPNLSSGPSPCPSSPSLRLPASTSRQWRHLARPYGLPPAPLPHQVPPAQDPEGEEQGRQAQGQGAQDPGGRPEEGFRRPHLRGSGPHLQGCGGIPPALKAFLLPQFPIFEASGLIIKAVEASDKEESKVRAQGQGAQVPGGRPEEGFRRPHL